MKRLTNARNRCVFCKAADEECAFAAGEFSAPCPDYKTYQRLSAIEEILGDDYDLDRLKELVEAYKEGRCAVLLPCKVGDKLYKISENGVKEVVVQSIVFMLSHTVNHLTVHVANERGAMTEIETKDFGKTVFLTLEEAESELERMKRGINNGCHKVFNGI